MLVGERAFKPGGITRDNRHNLGMPGAVELAIRPDDRVTIVDGGRARAEVWLQVRGDALLMMDTDGTLRDTLKYYVMPVDARGKAGNGIAKVTHVLLRPKAPSSA